MMNIGYDPEKNLINIKNRALPFDDVAELDWGSAYIKLDIRNNYGEDRYIALAYRGDRLHVVCFTVRQDTMWIISFRKANKREERRYVQETINR